MSKKSWREKYYPVPAREASKTAFEALEHSLRKWEGLRPAALREHRVSFKSESDSGHPNGGPIEVNAQSCALCWFATPAGHAELDEETGEPKNAPDCYRCPLYRVRGAACDQMREDDDSDGGIDTPWHKWTDNLDPEPMIALLKAAKEIV